MSMLRVEGLRTELRLRQGTAVAVRDLSLTLQAGETVALVGESGCGKTTAALSIMGLLSTPPAYITHGRILLHDENLLTVSSARLRQVRGEKIAMIFQEPMTALDPLFKIGAQIGETIRAHRQCSKEEARAMALQALERVHMRSPHQCLDLFPHQLSGGMRQRAMIAMALCLNPEVVIADEPTTALDVTVQAGILDLLAELREASGMTMLLITHNLAVVAKVANRVLVMYAGHVVESAPTADLLERPWHPYTQALLRSLPRLDRSVEILPAIRGSVPNLLGMPPGCPFAPRCELAEPGCQVEQQLIAISEGHWVRCWKRTA
jgi:oligopeptide transport system ATP-binding protein